MKITLNIETNDPADLERIAAALAGNGVAVTTGKPAAAAKKTETAASAGQTEQPKGTPAAASSPDAGGAVPSDQELIAAANVATGKVGVGGPDKVKSYIAANFKKADGSPATLKMTAEGQRGALLEALQKIGRGEIAL